jgi:hypothetical protein
MTWKNAVRALVGGSVAIVAVAGIALAEPKDAKEAQGGAPQMDEQTKAMMEEMAKYAAPGPEHAVLASMAGKWKTVSKSWMGPGEPFVSEGTAEGEMVMGGRYLILKSSGVMMGQPFEGMELMGYDRKTKEFVAYWVDNMGTAIYPMNQGTYDAATKTVTLKAEWPMPGEAKPVPYKLATKSVDADTQVFTMIAMRDGKEMTEMEITYTRVK